MRVINVITAGPQGQPGAQRRQRIAAAERRTVAAVRRTAAIRIRTVEGKHHTRQKLAEQGNYTVLVQWTF